MSDVVEFFKSIFPWLAGLDFLPKLIVSAILTATLVFLLVMMWSPQSDPGVSKIINDCNRLALITKTRQELNLEDMFSSLESARKLVQEHQKEIKRDDLKKIAANIVPALDQMERIAQSMPKFSHNFANTAKYADSLDQQKLTLIRTLNTLAKETGTIFPLQGGGFLGDKNYFGDKDISFPAKKAK